MARHVNYTVHIYRQPVKRWMVIFMDGLYIYIQYELS